MPYISKDNLGDFEFHDVLITSIERKGNDLYLTFDYLKTRNDTEFVTCENAVVKFQNAVIEHCRDLPGWHIDEKGNRIENEIRTFLGDDAESFIMQDIKHDPWIVGVSINDSEVRHRFEMDIISQIFSYETSISYSSAEIEFRLQN